MAIGPSVTGTWAFAVLKRLGLPQDATNVTALKLWAKAEGNLTGRGYNWLNTTTPAPGATTLPGNSAHVKNYSSFTQGVAITAQALKGSYYSGILRSMSTASAQSNTVTRVKLSKIYSAINTSPWDGARGSHPTASRACYPCTFQTWLLGKGVTVGTGTKGGGTAGGTTPTTGSGGTSTCTFSLPLVGCVLHPSQARALKGGLLIVAGGVLALSGLALLGAYGLGSRAAASQVRRVAKGAGLSAPQRQARARRRTQDEAERSYQAAGGAAGVRESAAAGRRVHRRETSGAYRPEDHPFTDADRTPDLRRRSAERRPGSKRRIPSTRTIRV